MESGSGEREPARPADREMAIAKYSKAMAQCKAMSRRKSVEGVKADYA